jgi:GxxExxY protein
MNPVAGKNIIYPELSYAVMQAIFEVHNQLGPGFSEEVYQRAVVIEFKKRGISFESQKVIQVVYNGDSIGSYRLDLVVDDKIVLELKAVTALNDTFKQQTLAYLKATGLKLGIPINFGTARVEYVRIVN